MGAREICRNSGKRMSAKKNEKKSRIKNRDINAVRGISRVTNFRILEGSRSGVMQDYGGGRPVY